MSYERIIHVQLFIQLKTQEQGVINKLTGKILC